eukprot:Pompholyxophrys_punicea_v1_NODE_599_length_1615_cov_3.125641.p1 type:complete len:227 gc:universal NODE_599_length_1615_cov_3.125641:419-1099(+)
MEEHKSDTRAKFTLFFEKTHVTEKWYNMVCCSLCRAKFPARENFLRHLTKVHEDGGYLFECGIDGCETLWTSVPRYRRHLRQKHTLAEEQIVNEEHHETNFDLPEDGGREPENIVQDSERILKFMPPNLLTKQEKFQMLGAEYLLKLTHQNSLSNTAVDNIVKETQGLIDDVTSEIFQKIQQQHNLPEEILDDFLPPKVFEGIDTPYLQKNFWREKSFPYCPLLSN